MKCHASRLRASQTAYRREQGEVGLKHHVCRSESGSEPVGKNGGQHHDSRQILTIWQAIHKPGENHIGVETEIAMGKGIGLQWYVIFQNADPMLLPRPAFLNAEAVGSPEVGVIVLEDVIHPPSNGTHQRRRQRRRRNGTPTTSNQRGAFMPLSRPTRGRCRRVGALR